MPILHAYGGEVRLEEALLYARPDGEGDDEQLVRVTHVVEGRDQKLDLRLVLSLGYIPTEPV